MKPKPLKDSSTDNTTLYIAGAHRSGTSMLARLLHNCGLYMRLDCDLVPGRGDNPDGFWENRWFV
ncbi:MAG TPA: hypothetical protein VK648_13110, partial [Gemmatimonadaceae bacterium]|nr:hypothetical protein [Gemmatimonadaceae bacterium]